MKSLLILLAIIGVGVWFYNASFFVTLLVISFLIFFHELGHFLAAKWLKVKVEVFSVGFGQTLWQKEFKGTSYRLSALPLGGYVRLKGQDDLNPSAEVLEQGSYSLLHPAQKMIILFAGPFFNIILAFLLYIVIAFLGESKLAAVVGEIAPNSAAQSANLQSGDKILAINGVQIQSFEEISKQVRAEPLLLSIKRGEQVLQITLTPQLGKGYNDFMQEIEKPLIGISPNGERVKVYHKGFESLSYAFYQSIDSSLLIVKGLAKLITGEIDSKNLGGVIMMTDITSKATERGLVVVLLITALISINLGVLNLLPIPVLDGGHIAFNLYELIFRRKVPPKAFEYLSYGGMALLLSLMIFATYNDIVRLSGF